MQNITIQSLCVGSLLSYKNKSKDDKKEVLLLGQGWFAKGFMDHINKNKFYITNITRHKFVNTPLLISESKTNDEINNFTKKIDKIIFDDIQEIDLEKKIVATKNNNYLWSDKYLVCGLGSNEDIGNKWLPIIEKIRTNLGLKKYCIIGAGPTGTELAFYLSDKNNKVDILDMASDVYNYVDSFGKVIILDHLEKFKIGLFCNTPYTENMKEKYDEIIFATGSKPNSLTKDWKITPELKLENFDNVFVGGDCINNSKLPRNAQVAYQQGKYVAETLNGNVEKDFEFNNKGISIYIGNGTHYVEHKDTGYKGKLPSEFIKLYYYLSNKI